jgi:4-amino-4-deoxy-L-arabinose transferase-like glycosyltransferase
MTSATIKTYFENSRTQYKASGLGLLLLSFLLTVLLRLPHYQHSFTFVDEAWWAQGAKTWLDGKLLYKDIWLDKNPPIFLFCGYMFRFFGVSTHAMHLGAIFLVCAISLGLYLIGRSFFSSKVGGLAAVIYALASTMFYTPRIIGLNSETLMVVFTTAAMGFFLRGILHSGNFYFWAAGLASSTAVFTKPVALIQMGLFTLILLADLQRTLLMRLRSLAYLASGFLAGVLAFAMYMQACGILDTWWHQAVLYGFTYVSQVPLTTFFRRLLSSTASFAIIYGWLAILIVSAWCRNADRESRPMRLLIISLWILSAWVGVIAGRRFYANYYIQMLPSMALAGSIGLASLLQQRHTRWAKRALTVSGSAFFAAFLWFHSATFAHWYFMFNPEAHRVSTFWGMCREDHEATQIATFLKSRTLPDDHIFIWGSKAQIYFLADREPAIPHMDYDVGNDVPPNAMSIPVRMQTASKLRDDLPVYIVDMQRHARLERFPIFWNTIKNNYVREHDIHGGRLYRLRWHLQCRLSQ